MSLSDVLLVVALGVNMAGWIRSLVLLERAHKAVAILLREKYALQTILRTQFGCAVTLTDHGDSVEAVCAIVQRPEGERVTFH